MYRKFFLAGTDLIKTTLPGFRPQKMLPQIPAHWQEAFLCPFATTSCSADTLKESREFNILSRPARMEISHYPNKFGCGHAKASSSITFQVSLDPSYSTHPPVYECILAIKEFVWDLFEKQVVDLGRQASATVFKLQDCHRMVVCMGKVFLVLKFPFDVQRGWCTILTDDIRQKDEIHDTITDICKIFPESRWEVITGPGCVPGTLFSHNMMRARLGMAMLVANPPRGELA